jgi:hypothetical protein
MISCKNSGSKSSSKVQLLNPPTPEYYQLKIYTFENENQENVTDKYLKSAFLPGLKRQGINNIGVFKYRPNQNDSIRKTFILTPFQSIDQFLSLEDALKKDQTYLETGREYINASYEQVPYQRIESILLKAFTDMPTMRPSALKGPRSERVYELRSYESPTERYFKNKVEMFNDGGEVKLFDKLEFNAVFYGEVISGGKMPNLMYMTTFSNQESRDAHWKTFGDAPEWKTLSAQPKYQKNVSHIDKTFLYPTEYSDY